jgi:hypothetical protein
MSFVTYKKIMRLRARIRKAFQVAIAESGFYKVISWLYKTLSFKVEK